MNYVTAGQKKTDIFMRKSLQGANKEGPFLSVMIGQIKRRTCGDWKTGIISGRVRTYLQIQSEIALSAGKRIFRYSQSLFQNRAPLGMTDWSYWWGALYQGQILECKL